MLSIKAIFKLSFIPLLPLLAAGCDTLFDKGDTEKVFEGEVLEFFPLNAETIEGAGPVNIAVQLIGAQKESDLSVRFGVDAENTTAVEGVHYTIETLSPVTLAANSSSADVTINVLGNSLEAGESAILVLVLQGAPEQGVEAAEELRTHNLIIVAEEDR